MGASSSSNDTRSMMSISTSEQETAAYSDDACFTKDQEQRTYVGTSSKDEDQPRSQVHCSCQRERSTFYSAFLFATLTLRVRVPTRF